MAMKARYTTVSGRVIAQKRSGARRLLRPDNLGSTVALYDNTGAKTDSWVYWPYGEVRSRTGTTTMPLQFVGGLGYYTDSTSMTYVRARFYRQGLGRWQTVDPLWPRQSPYAYVMSSPMNGVDPSGMLVIVLAPVTYEAACWTLVGLVIWATICAETFFDVLPRPSWDFPSFPRPAPPEPIGGGFGSNPYGLQPLPPLFPPLFPTIPRTGPCGPVTLPWDGRPRPPMKDPDDDREQCIYECLKDCAFKHLPLFGLPDPVAYQICADNCVWWCFLMAPIDSGPMGL